MSEMDNGKHAPVPPEGTDTPQDETPDDESPREVEYVEAEGDESVPIFERPEVRRMLLPGAVAVLALVLVVAIWLGTGDRDTRVHKAETPYSGPSTEMTIVYPLVTGLVREARLVAWDPARSPMGDAVVEEFLAGPSKKHEGASLVPPRASLNATYEGTDGIMYLDLSSEFRRNFRGDALSELLLMRALYESVAANVPNIEGVRVVIDGEEVESVGGHLLATSPLTEACYPEARRVQ